MRQNSVKELALMKTRSLAIAFSASLALIFCMTAAAYAQDTPTSSKSDTAPAADELHLRSYTKPSELVLKLAEFKALPHVSITVHNEHANADETYSGVHLADLLAKLNAPLGHDLRGPGLAAYVVATGSDGYVAVIALAEADPAFHPGDVIVADAMNGQPLDAKSGPFKLVVSEDKRPARWVRNLASVELRSAK
jgi:hypothetical protein